MKLVHPDITYQFELSENGFHTIVIENPFEFTRICQELYRQCAGEEGRFVLSEGDHILRIDKMMYMVIDPFSLDFNQKRIINKVYSEMKELALSSEMYLETNAILANIERYMIQLLAYSEYPATCAGELEVSSILKMTNIKMEEEYTNLAEKIVDYVKIMQDICNLPLCILVNIKAYLLENEIEKICEFAEYSKIHLVFLENVERKKMIKEKVYIWDKDSCEIY